MTSGAVDARHMARALKLAARGLNTTDPNPRVGCVIVRDGAVLGEGFHERAGGPHAELAAIAAAAGDVRGATVYVTLEPCSHHGRTPPCADALVSAGVRRVVYACHDPNPRVNGGGAARLAAAGVEVSGGVLEAAARALNPGFLSRMERGRPWVRVKLAASVDGRTALANGESRWITGEAARQDVHRWRARASAVLAGSGTVLRDDPRLDVRLPEASRQPLRVVVDSSLATPPAARVLAPPGEAVLLAEQGADPGRARALESAGARIEWLPPAATGGVDLRAALSRLAALEVNELHVEGGPTLAGALWKAGLVDEMLLYQAPVVLGEQARPLLVIGPVVDMADRGRLEIIDTRRVGPDLRIRLRPAH